MAAMALQLMLTPSSWWSSAWVLLKLKGEGTAHQTNQGTQPGAVGTALHFRRQRGAGAGGAAGADQAMQTVLDHHKVIGGISITLWRNGSGSSPSSNEPQCWQASGWCSTTASTRSIGSSSGPDP